ncbi:MAG: zf-HC2 domain-containing protein [Verrucomicrobiae bacterium]|nr:zf-HC2 domain-containing protein [Verrucomicrobiae bacterium]
MKNCESFKGLIVGLLDGELTPEETRLINEHLNRCAACRGEYEKLRETTGKLASVSFMEPTDAVLEQVWKSPYSRFARNASLGMIVGGYAVLILYGVYEFVTKGKEAMPEKIAVVAIVLGFVTLLLQLILERIRTYKSDPYKEIER